MILRLRTADLPGAKSINGPIAQSLNFSVGPVYGRDAAVDNLAYLP
jgi:hypothetical protein